MFNKNKKNQKTKKEKKPFSKNSFNNCVKALIFTYVLVSVIAGFSAHWVFGLIELFTLVLFYFVIKRKPVEELPKELSYCSQNTIDISPLPVDYKNKIQAVFVALYKDAERQDILVENKVITSDENK